MEDLDENSELFNRTKNRIIALNFALKFALKLDSSETFDKIVLSARSFEQIVLASRAFENYLNEPIADGQ